MRKSNVILIFISLLIFILSGCTTEGVKTSLYKDGEEVVNIINTSFETKEKLLSESDSKTLEHFFTKYETPEDENFKNKNEEFTYWITALEITNSNYQEAVEDFNTNKIKSNADDYQTILEKLQKDFKVELNKD